MAANPIIVRLASFAGVLETLQLPLSPPLPGVPSSARRPRRATAARWWRRTILHDLALEQRDTADGDRDQLPTFGPGGVQNVHLAFSALQVTEVHFQILPTLLQSPHGVLRSFARETWV